MMKTRTRSVQMGFGMLAAIWLAGTVQAWQPAGWVYMDWPWAYDGTSGDWHWFSADGTQWMYDYRPGAGWSKLPQSSLTHGWSYWDGAWAYDGESSGWCWRNTGGTQWVVNMHTSQWSLFGQEAAAGVYLVVDLSGGPDAASYPVSYREDVPAGGWTSEHKTFKLVLRKIPAGTFAMGSPAAELGRSIDEDLHTVTLTKDFYLGVFEVTQRQWELVMGNKPSYFNNSAFYPMRPVETVSTYEIRENPANSDDPLVNWPANRVVNASSFMGKLRAKTGLTTFDLPTESQWEYACRAGTATALNSGKNLTSEESCPNMAEVGRYWGNGGSTYSQGCALNAGSAMVGSYLPNVWGLYDTHGNVWELCLDCYGTYPGVVTDPAGVASGRTRVERGGSWAFDAKDCRSASRNNNWPDDRRSHIGFRAARTLP